MSRKIMSDKQMFHFSILCKFMEMSKHEWKRSQWKMKRKWTTKNEVWPSPENEIFFCIFCFMVQTAPYNYLIPFYMSYGDECELTQSKMQALPNQLNLISLLWWLPGLRLLLPVNTFFLCDLTIICCGSPLVHLHPHSPRLLNLLSPEPAAHNNQAPSLRKST